MTAAFTKQVRQIVWDRCQLRSHCMCEICGLGKPTDIHHRAPRGVGGSKDTRLGLPSNALALCRPCHDMVESDRLRAYDRGWLIHKGWLDRNDMTAAEVPVVYGGSWAILTDDGAVFRPPVGRDRCARCGFDVPSQGHRSGCQAVA